MRAKRWQIHLLVLVAYTLFALALTWPLVVHFGSHVPGDGADDPPLTWNLWWVQYALLHLGENPFDGSYMFYPLGINLAFYTLTVLNGLLSIPLQATVGLIPASNLLLLSSFVLSGYGAFLLASYCLSRAPEPFQPPPSPLVRQRSKVNGAGDASKHVRIEPSIPQAHPVWTNPLLGPHPDGPDPGQKPSQPTTGGRLFRREPP